MDLPRIERWLAGVWVLSWLGATGARAEPANNFNVNGVLRWEIRPGSTLYAVYRHGAFNVDVFHRDGTLSRHALPALLHAPSDDVLQVKLSWMFR
jgi:hypothetical protein